MVIECAKPAVCEAVISQQTDIVVYSVVVTLMVVVLWSVLHLSLQAEDTSPVREQEPV